MSNKRKLTGLSGGGNPQNPSLRDQLTALTGKVALIDFVLGLTLQTFGLRTDIQQPSNLVDPGGQSKVHIALVPLEKLPHERVEPAIMDIIRACLSRPNEAGLIGEIKELRETLAGLLTLHLEYCSFHGPPEDAEYIKKTQELLGRYQPKKHEGSPEKDDGVN